MRLDHNIKSKSKKITMQNPQSAKIVRDKLERKFFKKKWFKKYRFEKKDN
jgi:hypothetical protein